MAILTQLEELKNYAADYRNVPVAKEILSDGVTPMEVLRRLKKVSKHVYILESVVNQAYFGRYTFLGYEPKFTINLRDGLLKVRKFQEESTKGEKMEEIYEIGKGHRYESPNEYLREVISQYKSPRIKTLPTFTGGLVGYFAYDFIKYSEPVLDLDARDEDEFDDMNLMLFDKVIAFDNIMQRLVLITNIATDNLSENYAQALAELDQMEELVTEGQKQVVPKGKLLSDFRPLFTKEEYCQMVEKGKKYIYEGDIFQVVLSNRLEADFAGSLLDTYRQLRASNPSPYMFYLDMDGEEIAGASPETLTKLDSGELYTFPLAGTRPRGKTPEEDAELEKGLLKDEKELAEHNMLVDLGRNDLGKISKFGSVEVMKYMSIERYSHVMHIGSTVKGIIDDKHDAIDAVAAVQPAGTLSGAPKIRACEIINELENSKRGVYGGAIGYLDFTGNMDTCIAIRFAYKKNSKVFVRAGAGIVADSVPETEAQECHNKAAAVMKALRAANEM